MRLEEGTVLLRVKVNPVGKVQETSLEEACPYPALNRAACEAVSRWEMAPARVDGVAVADTIRIPIVFQLRPVASKSKS